MNEIRLCTWSCDTVIPDFGLPIWVWQYVAPPALLILLVLGCWWFAGIIFDSIYGLAEISSWRRRR